MKRELGDLYILALKMTRFIVFLFSLPLYSSHGWYSRSSLTLYETSYKLSHGLAGCSPMGHEGCVDWFCTARRCCMQAHMFHETIFIFMNVGLGGHMGRTEDQWGQGSEPGPLGLMGRGFLRLGLPRGRSPQEHHPGISTCGY